MALMLGGNIVNIASGTREGSSTTNSSASYSYFNSVEDVSFPREALTENSENYFTDLTFAKAYVEEGHEVAYVGTYSDSWKVLQNSESWGSLPNSNIYFIFNEAVTPSVFHSYIGNNGWGLYATNDWDIFSAKNIDYMDALIGNGPNTSQIGGVDTEIGDGISAYKYYLFRYIHSYEDISVINLVVKTGNKRLILNNSSMTPSITVGAEGAIQINTQEWFDGSQIISSKTLSFKPYEDGGCLVNYDDDNKAIDLELYYCYSSGTTTVDDRYILSPSSNFTLDGYNSKVKVGSISLPNRD